MGWSIGYDKHWKRDIGYGVPAYCDHPGCRVEIDRGLGYVCGGEPYGGAHGCGLYFCQQHGGGYRCARCRASKPPYKRPSPEHHEWMEHKLSHESWGEWRAEYPEMVAAMKALIATTKAKGKTK